MVEGEDVASDDLMGIASVCGEQGVYGRDVVRVDGYIRHSGAWAVQARGGSSGCLYPQWQGTVVVYSEAGQQVWVVLVSWAIMCEASLQVGSVRW